MDSPTQIRFESTRMAHRRVVYDPTTSLARFERDMRSDRERRYAWAERRARKQRGRGDLEAQHAEWLPTDEDY